MAAPPPFKRLPARPERERSFRRFAEEYDADLNPRAAAVRAGFEPQDGPKLLAKPGVQGMIRELRAGRSGRVGVHAEEVLRAWDEARRVDYREFAEVHIPACRYCWGDGHDYQFTPAEQSEAKREHQERYAKLNKDPPPFDLRGGIGYDRNKLPCRSANWYLLHHISCSSDEEAERYANSDHDCPECSGFGGECVLGQPLLIVHSTRQLSRAALYVFQGVTFNQAGRPTYNLRSRREMDEMVARHLGMFNDRKPVNVFDVEGMNDGQLDTAIATLEERLEDADVEFGGEFGQPGGAGPDAEGGGAPSLAPPREAE